MSGKYSTPSLTSTNPVINGSHITSGSMYTNLPLSLSTTNPAYIAASNTTTTANHQHLIQMIRAQNICTTRQSSTNSVSSPILNITLQSYQKLVSNKSGVTIPNGHDSGRDLFLHDGVEYNITLPDGTKVEVKADGSFELIDKDATVKYRACRVREFNPFLNASDKLEAFIRFCGTVGVRQTEVLRLPVELFISWLIIEAARQDNEPEPDIPLITSLKQQAFPRCTACGRFMSRIKRAKKLEFCAPRCFEIHYAKALA